MSTQAQIDNLQEQINDLSAALANTISGRELTAVLTTLERDFAVVKSTTNTLDPRVTRIQAQVNSVTTRFKRYASNEKEINESAAVLPASNEKAALAGTQGTPGDLNRYATNSDPRLSNERYPTPHASSHASGELDSLSHGDLAEIGLRTHAQLDQELDMIWADQDDQDVRMTSIEDEASGHNHDSSYIRFSTVISPTTEADPVGSIKADDNFIYVKTNSGWKKAPLTT